MSPVTNPPPWHLTPDQDRAARDHLRDLHHRTTRFADTTTSPEAALTALAAFGGAVGLYAHLTGTDSDTTWHQIATTTSTPPH